MSADEFELEGTDVSVSDLQDELRFSRGDSFLGGPFGAVSTTTRAFPVT